jgi:methionine aminopeptidase
VHDYTVEHGAYPSPLHYHNFPKSVCISINEVVCHGIPDMRELQRGDIVNVDVSCLLNGFHGDLNETFVVGDVDDKSKKLVKVCGPELPVPAIARAHVLCTHHMRLLCRRMCKVMNADVQRPLPARCACAQQCTPDCIYSVSLHVDAGGLTASFVTHALVQVAYECLMRAIAAVRPGALRDHVDV